MKVNHLKNRIRKSFRRLLSENVANQLNLNQNYIDDLKNELSKFKTSEELLRGGGLSIETLDRLAYGFSSEDIKQINPSKLKIKWKDDLENVKWEIQKSGLTPKAWASKINLNEPIDVAYWGDKRHKLGFYIEDGHHRYMAAKILKKPLNVNLEIKANPIVYIAPNLGYDEFHRYIFDLYGPNSKKINESETKSISVFHGTNTKFIDDIKGNGLVDKTGYGQGHYMVSTDFESALYHANPNTENGEVYVIEFQIPIVQNSKWLGYPYLWKPQKRNDQSSWFALMKQIPKEFIKKIYRVDYDKWVEQKNKGL